MRKIILGLCTAMLGLGGVSVATAEPMLADIANTPWEKIQEGVWEKKLGGFFGQAQLRLMREKRTRFSVSVPCGEGDDRVQTFTWKAGDKWGKAKPVCDGWPTETRAKEWVEWFIPLPPDFAPGTVPAPKKIEKQPGLMV